MLRSVELVPSNTYQSDALKRSKGSRKVIFRVTKKMSVSQLENIKCSLRLISKPEVNTENFVSF